MVIMTFQSPSGMKGRLAGNLDKARIVVRKMRESGWEVVRVLNDAEELTAEELDDGW